VCSHQLLTCLLPSSGRGIHRSCTQRRSGPNRADLADLCHLDRQYNTTNPGTRALLRRLIWDNGVVALVVAAFTFSIMALCVKLVAGTIPVFQIVFYRSLVSFGLTIWLAHARQVSPIFGSPNRMGWLILRGLLGTMGMTLNYATIMTLPLATAVTIFFTNPAFTVVMEWLTLGEPIGWAGAFSCVACIAGAHAAPPRQLSLCRLSPARMHHDAP
jgi:uncharacterized membrane protein